jgi:hypothetical protein
MFRMIFLWVAVSVSACGFTPLYQQPVNQLGYDAQANIVPSAVQIRLLSVDGPRIERQQLKSFLEEQFHMSSVTPSMNDDHYQLYVTFSKNTVPLSIERDRRVTRYGVNIIAHYQVKSSRDAKLITQGREHLSGSYDALISRYAMYVSESDMTRNLLRELAAQLKIRIVASLLRDQ